MRILIIANPGVGIDKTKRDIVDNLVSKLTALDNRVAVTYSYKPGMGRKYAAMARFEGYKAVYAAGGDGTVNDVASGLLKTGIPLGIIPLGTGNGFARGMGIPLDEKGFTEVLLRHRVIDIDTGKLSAHTFVATAGVGFDASIAADFNASYKSNRSIPGYLWLGVKNYFKNRAQEMTLVVDGKEITRTLFGLTLANTSQYGSGAVIAPQADPASGKLVAVLIPKLNPFSAASAMKKLFNGAADTIPRLEFIEFTSLKIRRNKPGLYHVDGEAYKGTAALNATVQPGSLRVIVP